MTPRDHYFANALERHEPEHHRAIALCGCGCMGEGCITYHAVDHIRERYGDDLRGALLTFEGHGPGVHTGKGGVFWLAPAPPVVVYESPSLRAFDLVVAANAALRGMARRRAAS